MKDNHKTWSCATLVLVTAACTSPHRAPIPGAPGGAPGTLRVRTADGAIRRVSLEDYVRGTILAEVGPASTDPELTARMLEVQAVVARSYAVAHRSRHAREGYNLCSTTHCQLYDPSRLTSSRWAPAATRAARGTAGKVLWYESAPASALFHADCGGHTSADGDVWGGAASPYLAAVADDGPARDAHGAWQFVVATEKLRAALNAEQRTSVGARLTGVSVVRRDEGGRAALVALAGARAPVVRGEELRAVLSRAFGPLAIRSTKLEVTRSGSTFVFSGRGHGHGVGLCQAGALARLRAGIRPEGVLARYYPGTRIIVLR